MRACWKVSTRSHNARMLLSFPVDHIVVVGVPLAAPARFIGLFEDEHGPLWQYERIVAGYSGKRGGSATLSRLTFVIHHREIHR